MQLRLVSHHVYWADQARRDSKRATAYWPGENDSISDISPSFTEKQFQQFVVMQVIGSSSWGSWWWWWWGRISSLVELCCHLLAAVVTDSYKSIYSVKCVQHRVSVLGQQNRTALQKDHKTYQRQNESKRKERNKIWISDLSYFFVFPARSWRVRAPIPHKVRTTIHIFSFISTQKLSL